MVCEDSCNILHSSRGTVNNMTLCERLVEERKRLGLTQARFAELGGVSKRSQIAYEQGRPPTTDYLVAIAAAGVDVLYVVTGERRHAPSPLTSQRDVVSALALLPGAVARDLAFGGLVGPRSVDPEEFAPIPLYDAELAAGDGALNGTEAVIGELAFRRDWLRDRGIDPGQAVLARARGDSMAPAIRDGDMLLIDRSDLSGPARIRARGDTRPPRIYALLDDGEARVKRLELVAPGQLAVLSDNPAHPPEFRPAADLSIIGRVRWWGHTERE